MAEKKNDLIGWLALRRPPDYTKARCFGSFLGCLVIVLIATCAAIGFVLFSALFIEVIVKGSFTTSDGAKTIRDLLAANIALFGAPFLVWRTLIASKQAGIAERSLIAERFSRAVGQLTSLTGDQAPDIISRISGLNEMAQIALDYGETYQRRVAITMCEFIRFNCTQHSKTLDKKVLGAYALRADVAVAFDILKDLQSNGYTERLNLTQIDFIKLSLKGRKLKNANFAGSDFRHSNLDQVEFLDCSFQNCRFGHSPKFGDLPPVYWTGAKLWNADWTDAKFKNFNFVSCDLSGSKFDNTTLSKHIRFSNVTVVGAGFKMTHLAKYEDGEDHVRFPQLSCFLAKMFSDASSSWPQDIEPGQTDKTEHWPNEHLLQSEFETQWRAWQKSIGFDPENPEGSA